MMMPARFAARLLLTALLAITPMTFMACQKSTTPVTNPQRNENLDTALRAYNRSDYSDAYAKASTLSISSDGLLKDEAQLLAGLSAYRLGDAAKATRFLEPASRSTDKRVSGKAHATLGLMAAGNSDQLPAQRHLSTAVRKLEGREEKAQARYQLGIVQQKLGKWADAKGQLALASRESNDSKLRRNALERAKYKAWGIQVGAYSTEKMAKSKAQEFAKLASQKQAGGTYVVIGLTPDSKVLYLVRIGRYANLYTANTMKTRLGLKETFITPVK